MKIGGKKGKTKRFFVDVGRQEKRKTKESGLPIVIICFYFYRVVPIKVPITPMMRETVARAEVKGTRMAPRKILDWPFSRKFPK